jgi:F-type H+-transporting ATPase subunit delta
MPNETLARRYATAVFQLAQDAGKASAIGRDLHAFIDMLDANDSVRRFFRSPVVDRAEKADVIGQALASFDPIAKHTLLLLVRKRRETLVDEMVHQFDLLDRAARGSQALDVVSARPLAQAELDAIVARLAKSYDTTFDVTHTVDPDLLGGVRITMGDRQADGTIAGRLDDIARILSTN